MNGGRATGKTNVSSRKHPALRVEDVEGASGGIFPCLSPRKTRLFLKILLRGFKRSLISAARPNKLGGSDDGVNEILNKFDLTTKFEQVYVSFAGETSEAGRGTGNVLIVLGLQIGSILSRLN